MKIWTSMTIMKRKAAGLLAASTLVGALGTNAAEAPLPWEQTVKEFMALQQQMRYEEGEHLLTGRLDVESRHDGRGVLYFWLANVSLETGRIESAEAAFSHSVTELRAAYGARSSALLRPLLQLTWLHQETGRIRRAELDFEQILGLEPGKSSEDRLMLLHTGAMLLDARGKLRQAEAEYRRVAAISESTLGPANPLTAVILNNLGAILVRRKQYAEALPILVNAVASLAQGSRLDRIRAVINLANAYHKAGDDMAAERTSAEAISTIVQAYGHDHPHMRHVLYLRADILKRLGRKREAADALDRAAEITSSLQRHTVALRDLSNRR